MSTQENGSLEALIKRILKGIRTGMAIIVDSSEVAATASVPVYSDANSNVQVGGFPFVVPFVAGVTNTANAVFSVEGSTTGSANELMHQTLVLGSSVTTFTKTGFIRVTVTDDAGNITNGDHFIQIGTLS